MGGQGTFVDPRIGVKRFHFPDRVTPKLPALLAYQLSLEAPEPPPGSFDAERAERGERVFRGKGRCSSCHEGKLLTDANHTLHRPRETCMDPEYASRSATGLYRTTPLRALWQHPPYFHDGSAKTLRDVVEHYDDCLDLGLDRREKRDLVEYLKTL